MADNSEKIDQLADLNTPVTSSVASLVTTDDPLTSDPKKVVLPENCIVIINGQKCKLKISPTSDVLVAYPIDKDEEDATILTQPDTGEQTVDELQQVSVQDMEESSAMVIDTFSEDTHQDPDLDQVVIHASDLEEESALTAAHDSIITQTDSQVIESSSQVLSDSTRVIQVSVGETQVSDSTVLVGTSSDAAKGLLKLSSPEKQAEREDKSKGKIPVPRMIIPSVGGHMTSTVISQEQVAAVTNIDPASVLQQTGGSTASDDVYDELLLEPGSSLTNLQSIKPVLKQYLIRVPQSNSNAATEFPSEDFNDLGIKTSQIDLEKLKCVKCSFQAFYPQQYEQHLKETHNDDDLAKCKCCSFVTLKQSDLIPHYLESHPRNICGICHHISEHAYVIKRHMHRHSSDGCTCEICGKVYKDQYILKMHVKMVHTQAEVLYQCDVCTKKFTRKAHLKRHLRTHSTDKAFACPQCDYRGCERSDVTKHMLVHEAPKLLCEICGKTFRHQKNKDLHLKRHNGQRDFKCGVCEFYGYTFTDIRKHIERRHTEWKTVMCTQCHVSFNTELALQDHINQWHKPASTSSVEHTVAISSSVTGSAGADTGVLVDDMSQVLPQQTLIIHPDGSMSTEEGHLLTMTTADGADEPVMGETEHVVEFTSSVDDVSSLGQQQHFASQVGSTSSAELVSSADTTDMTDLSITLC